MVNTRKTASIKSEEIVKKPYISGSMKIPLQIRDKYRNIMMKKKLESEKNVEVELKRVILENAANSHITKSQWNMFNIDTNNEEEEEEEEEEREEDLVIDETVTTQNNTDETHLQETMEAVDSQPSTSKQTVSTNSLFSIELSEDESSDTVQTLTNPQEKLNSKIESDNNQASAKDDDTENIPDETLSVVDESDLEDDSDSISGSGDDETQTLVGVICPENDIEEIQTNTDRIIHTNDNQQIKVENETAIDLTIKQFNENIGDDDDLAYSLDNLKIEIGINNLYFCYINKKFAIRDFYKSNDGGHELIQGNRGCELSINVVYELLNKLHYVDIDMERFRKGQVVSEMYKLGEGWYLTVTHPFPLVHIRKFETKGYSDKPSIPTKDGIAFKFFEYVKFQEVAESMKGLVPELYSFEPCYKTHKRYEELKCKFCNAFAKYIKTT